MKKPLTKQEQARVNELIKARFEKERQKLLKDKQEDKKNKKNG